MGRFSKKLFVYSNGKDIAITQAHSKEEAIHTFEKQFKDVIGSDVNELEWNLYGIGVVKK